MLSYRNLSMAAAMAAISVSIVYAFIPVVANFFFGIEGDLESNYVLRRSGFLLFGVGIIAWMSRNEMPSIARVAITRGIAIAMFGVMLSAIYEVFFGIAGPLIWVLIILEAFFGAAFLYYSFEKAEQSG